MFAHLKVVVLSVGLLLVLSQVRSIATAPDKTFGPSQGAENSGLRLQSAQNQLTARATLQAITIGH